MLFRPVRTLILIVVAYQAGVFSERARQAERCAAVTGALHDILCEVDP